MPHTLFPTAFGTCGIAWEERGLTGFQLPESDVADTERHLASKAGSKPADVPRPEWMRRLVERVQAHLEGKLQDFADAARDIAGQRDLGHRGGTAGRPGSGSRGPGTTGVW